LGRLGGQVFEDQLWIGLLLGLGLGLAVSVLIEVSRRVWQWPAPPGRGPPPGGAGRARGGAGRPVGHGWGDNAMAWVIVITAGVFETGFAVFLKMSHGLTKLWPTVGFAICALISFGLLTLALKHL